MRGWLFLLRPGPEPIRSTQVHITLCQMWEDGRERITHVVLRPCYSLVMAFQCFDRTGLIGASAYLCGTCAGRSQECSQNSFMTHLHAVMSKAWCRLPYALRATSLAIPRSSEATLPHPLCVVLPQQKQRCCNCNVGSSAMANSMAPGSQISLYLSHSFRY